MAIYITLEKDKPRLVSLSEIQSLLRENNLEEFSKESLEKIGVFEVVYDERPEYNIWKQKIKLGDFYNRDGVWRRRWDVYPQPLNNSSDILNKLWSNAKGTPEELDDYKKELLDTKGKKVFYYHTPRSDQT